MVDYEAKHSMNRKHFIQTSELNKMEIKILWSAQKKIYRYIIKWNFSVFFLTFLLNKQHIFLSIIIDKTKILFKCPVPINVKQTPLFPLKSGQIGFLVQKESQCPESCEKTIFNFLIFEKWSILNLKWFSS